MSTRWRILRDAPGSAAHNMAVDEALLRHVAHSGPTLRLYTWRRPSLSLGYRQPAPAWIERARDAGLEVVRRVTGGGAVLHSGDLTYAVVAPLGVPEIPDDLSGSYAWIQAALVAALGDLGLAVRPALGGNGADRLAVCFAGATGFEIELAGRKLVGSAQRRTSWGFLQHGSIRLRDDSALYAKLLLPEPPPAIDLPALEAGTVMDALERTFADKLDSPLVSAPLSEAERHLARTRASLRASDALARLPLASSGPPIYADSSF